MDTILTKLDEMQIQIKELREKIIDLNENKSKENKLVNINSNDDENNNNNDDILFEFSLLLNILFIHNI